MKLPTNDEVGRAVEERLKAHPPIITVTEGMSGWFAVLMVWNDEGADPSQGLIGFYEPETTGAERYATRIDAEEDAKEWALIEGIEYRE